MRADRLHRWRIADPERLPALAWLLSFMKWTEPRRLRVVQLATAGYLIVAAVVAIANATVP
jgi:hypothetical protein